MTIIETQRNLIREINKVNSQYKEDVKKHFFSLDIIEAQKFSWIIFFDQIKEINELTSFLLNIKNKKYAAFPIRTSLEILYLLEDFVRSKEKNEYFELLEKKDRKIFIDDDNCPFDIKSSRNKKNHYKLSQQSRISNYDIYKMMSGVCHGNSFATRIISRNRNIYYSFFLLYMIEIQMALCDLLLQVECEFTKKRSESNKEKLSKFLKEYGKIKSDLLYQLKK